PHQQTLSDAGQIATALRGTYQWSKPIWLTEIGYSSNPAFEESSYQGEQGQAQWLTDTLPQIPTLGIERLFWAVLQDETSGYTADSAYGKNGLLDSNEQPKPAFEALRNLLSSLP